MNHSTKGGEQVTPLYGVASYQGVECDSGHRAAVGVTLDISGVGSPKRPNPEEFEEVVRKARAKLNNGAAGKV